MKEVERQRVVAALGSTVEEIRYRAVRRLLEVFEKPPIEHLLRALGDESWRVRKCASEMFVGSEPDPDLIAALTQALSEEDNAGLRNTATEALVKIGAPAIPALIDVLKKGDKDGRKLAADIMGDIGDRRAIQPLLAAMKDRDENVRAAAAEALGIIGDPSVIDHLVKALRDEGLLVQLSCLDALDRLNAEIPAEILHSFLGVRPLRSHLYRLMGNLRDKGVIPTLLEGLQARGRVERAAASTALVQQYRQSDQRMRVEIQVSVGRAASDQIVENLRTMLASSVSGERSAATTILGWTGRVDVVEDLIRAASDEQLRDLAQESILSIGPKSAEVLCKLLNSLGRVEKVLSVDILGHFGLPSSLSYIVDLCLSEDQEVAEMAQRSLGKVGNPTIVGTLAELLKREYESPPKGAVASLILLGVKFHDQVVATMKPLLEGERPGPRIAAAEVLCGVVRKTDLEEVTRLVGDKDWEVRAAAVRALGRVGGPAAVERLRMALADESPKVRAAAARALGSRDSSEAREVLRVALGDVDPWVVKEALYALGQSGAPDVADSLLSYINHHNGAVALEAVRSLNRLKWCGSASRLVEASRHPDPEVVKEVLAGCNRWPADEVRQVLFSALGDPRWDVRISAVKKIGEMEDPVGIKAISERLPMEGDDLVREAMEHVLEMGKQVPLEE